MKSALVDSDTISIVFGASGSWLLAGTKSSLEQPAIEPRASAPAPAPPALSTSRRVMPRAATAAAQGNGRLLAHDQIGAGRQQRYAQYAFEGERPLLQPEDAGAVDDHR